MSTLPPEQLPKCKSCLKWNAKAKPTKRRKSNKSDQKNSAEAALRPLHTVHVDKGYMPVSTWDREFYFQVIVDFCTRRIWQQRLTLKSQDFEAFKWWYKQVRAEKPNCSLVKLICDNEYDKGNFRGLAKDEGFLLSPKSAYTGKAWLAERAIGLLRKVTMPQLELASASPHDWGFSMDHAEVLLNESWTTFLPSRVTREQAWQAGTPQEAFWAENPQAIRPRRKGDTIVGGHLRP